MHLLDISNYKEFGNGKAKIASWQYQSFFSEPSEQVMEWLRCLMMGAGQVLEELLNAHFWSPWVIPILPRECLKVDEADVFCKIFRALELPEHDELQVCGSSQNKHPQLPVHSKITCCSGQASLPQYLHSLTLYSVFSQLYWHGCLWHSWIN